MLDFELIKKSLSKLFPKENIFLYKCTDSTNNRALEYGKKGGLTPAVFIAEEQTGGRGRRGRSFVSNPNAAIFVTFLLSPEDIGEIEGATAFSAVAAREAILSNTGIHAGIKWVNDLYAPTPTKESKKLAGILTEGVTQDGKIEKIAIGIGINVYKSALSEEISSIATSLEEVSGICFNREALLLSLAKSILKRRTKEEVLYEYRRHSFTLGKRVEVRPHTAPCYDARAKEILDDYSLLVEKDDGEEIRVFSGEVSVKPTE